METISISLYSLPASSQNSSALYFEGTSYHIKLKTKARHKLLSERYSP